MNTLTISMALLMGFTGSLHCAGMCGPIVWVMPFQAFKGVKKAAALALYHGGRISVYALLAVVLHSFRDLFNPQVQQYVSIFLGVALLVAGVLTFVPGHFSKIRLPWAGAVQRQLGRVVGRPGLGTLAVTGALNGMLPCGLVYMALSASLVANTAIDSAAMMYMFGLGTMPMLIGISLLKSRLSFLRSAQVRKMVPAVMVVFGCLFVLRGMNLGIPYLSPKVSVEQHTIKSCCCHKK